MSKHNYFDKQVQQKLQGHEAPVPADAWANIQKGRRRKRPVMWLWFFAALLLGSVTVLYHYYTDDGIKNKTENIALIEKNNPAPNNTGKNKSNANAALSDNVASIKESLADDNNKLALPIKSIIKDDNNGTTSPVRKPAADAAMPTINNNAMAKNKASNNNKQYYNKKKKKNANAVQLVFTAKPAHQDDIVIHNTKKIKITQTGKTNMQVQVPDSEMKEEDQVMVSVNPATVSEKQDEIMDTQNNKDTVATAMQQHLKESVMQQPVTTKNNGTQHKKVKTFGIDIGFSAFVLFGNHAHITSINRSLTTPLNQAVFTAEKVRIRLQPAPAFNVQLFKNISPKTTVAAGLRYSRVKEYIHLSGEEVNTSLTVVKRLQNGNSLVNDTLRRTTTGIRTINAINSYHFLSIPINIRYQVLQQQQWLLAVQAGIDINLPTKYHNSIEGTLIPQFANTNKTRRNQSIGAGFNAGIRLSRQMGKNYWLYASPYIEFYPQKLYLHQMPAPRNMHRAGISLGINYAL